MGRMPAQGAARRQHLAERGAHATGCSGKRRPQPSPLAALGARAAALPPPTGRLTGWRLQWLQRMKGGEASHAERGTAVREGGCKKRLDGLGDAPAGSGGHGVKARGTTGGLTGGCTRGAQDDWIWRNKGEREESGFVRATREQRNPRTSRERRGVGDGRAGARYGKPCMSKHGGDMCWYRRGQP
jgi:hypothetical protein